MQKIAVVDAVGNVLIAIVITAITGVLLYGYVNASEEEKNLIFWFTVTQPQE